MVDVDVTWVMNAEIKDISGMGPAMTMQFQSMQGMDFKKETDRGYEKSITVKSKYKGTEKVSHEQNGKSCSIILIIGNRYIVTLAGNGFDDVKILHSLLDSMDLAKLEALKP